MINIILSGCYGKMCRVINELAQSDADIAVSCGVDMMAGKLPNPFSFPVYESFGDAAVKGDVIIDFSRPELLDNLLAYAVAKNTPVVIATTGQGDSEIAAIEKAARSIPVFFTANMSLGVNLLSALVKKAAEFLGPDFDIEIVETHHNKKVDAPSGTALMLAKSAAEGSEQAKEFCYGRYGKDAARKSNDIGIHAVRGGTVVGEHSVLFLGDSEVIELKHSAQSKQIFARGAIRAAKFLVQCKSGKYEMDDMLRQTK